MYTFKVYEQWIDLQTSWNDDHSQFSERHLP